MRGIPCSSLIVMVNEMGAHSDSGQHHTVSPSTPSMTGARTPHSMLPVMRKGTSVFEVRKRRPAAASASRARSRSPMEANSISKDCLLPSAGRNSWGGSSAAMASYSSKCSFFTKITGGARNSAMALVTTGRTSSSASSSRT